MGIARRPLSKRLVLGAALLEDPVACLNNGTYCSTTSYPAGGLQRGSQGGDGALNDAVTILVVEDDQLIQAMVEEGFQTAALPQP